MQCNSAARLDRMTCSLHACATPHWCEWTALNSLSICMCEHAGSVSQINAMYFFCSGQWCFFFFFSFSFPAEVALHTVLPHNHTFFLLSNQESSPRNRRLFLDSCMPFKTFLAIISSFNASSLIRLHTYRMSSCIPGLQWDRMRSEHLGGSKQCGLRPPPLYRCECVFQYGFVCPK